MLVKIGQNNACICLVRKKVTLCLACNSIRYVFTVKIIILQRKIFYAITTLMVFSRDNAPYDLRKRFKYTYVHFTFYDNDSCQNKRETKDLYETILPNNESEAENCIDV